MAGIANIIASGFLADVQSVCNSTEDDCERLGNFFLSGRGWKPLEILQTVGVQNLSCSHELITLLLSLLPICCKLPLTGDKTELLRVRKSLLMEKKFQDDSFTKFSSVSFHNHKENDEQSIDKTSSVEPYDGHCDSQQASSSNILSPEDLDKYNEKSVLEFFSLVLSVLQQFCKSDHYQSNLSKTFSPLVLPVLQEIIYTLESQGLDCCGDGWTPEDVTYIERVSLQTLFVVCNVLSITTNGIKLLHENQTISPLLKTAVIAHRTLSKNTELCDSKMDFYCDILNGVLNIFVRILKTQQDYPSEAETALSIIKVFSDDNGFFLLRELISSWDHKTQTKSSDEEAESYVKQLLLLVVNVVNAIVKLKVKYLHSVKCLKHRHKMCSFEMYAHHHNDFSGALFNNVYGNNNYERLKEKVGNLEISQCLISSWNHFVLKMICDVKTSSIQAVILKSLSTCSSCCCLPPEVLMEFLLDNFDSNPYKTRLKALQILITFLIHQCDTDKPQACGFCFGRLKLTSVLKVYDFDDAFPGLDADDDVTVNKKWLCLSKITNLMNSENVLLASQISRYILQLVQYGNSDVRYHLFILTYLPTLRSCLQKLKDYRKEKTNVGNNDEFPSRTLLLHCLSALPLLLRTQATQLVFHISGCLEEAIEIFEFPSLTKSILKIFEVLIVTVDDKYKEDSKLENTCRAAVSLFLGVFFHRFDGSHNLVKTTLAHQIPDYLGLDSSFWITCERLFTHSKTFRDEFLYRSGGSICETQLMKTTEVLKMQTSIECKENVLKKDGLFQILKLFESQTVICLGSLSFQQTLIREKAIADFLWNLQSSLSSHTTWETSVLSRVLSCLLSCATPRSTVEHILKENTMEGLFDLEDTFEENDEESQSSDFESSLDSVFVEDGYDGDEEGFRDDDKKSFGKHWKENPNSPREYSNDKMLVYPQIFKSIFQILQQVGPASSELSVIIFERLQLLIKENSFNAALLYRTGLVSTLLENYKDVLSMEVYAGSKEQIMVLDIFTNLARYAFSSTELRLFLRFFIQEKPALKSLLTTMLNLADNLFVQPTYILSYPAIKPSECSQNWEKSPSPPFGRKHSAVDCSGSFTFVSYQEALGFSPKKGSLDKAISKLQVNNGKIIDKLSPWTCSAAHMPLSDNLKWPPLKNGFCVSLWLRAQAGCFRTLQKLKRNQKDVNNDSWICTSTSDSDSCHRKPRFRSKSSRLVTNNCLHIFSVGSKELLFEVWVEPKKGTLLFRITSTWINPNIIAESSTKLSLTPGCWEHVCLSYSEELNDKKYVVGKVICTLGGLMEEEINFDYQHLQISPNNTTLFVGHSVQDNEWKYISGTWQLGNLMLFKDCVLTQEACFHLYALGPDCTTVSHCDSSDQVPVYTHLINEQLLQNSNLSYEVLKGISSISLNNLREQLLLVYLARNPSDYLLYPSLSRKNGSHPRIPDLFGFSKNKPTNFLLQEPFQMNAGLMANTVPQIHEGISGAIDNIGGIGVFVVLYARIVEKFDDEDLQALALEVLLKLVQHSPKYAKEFEVVGGFRLLYKVLITKRCIVGFEVLKVFLDVCLSEPILKFDCNSKRYQLESKTTSVIQDTEVIDEIIMAWKVWQPLEDSNVWNTAFKAIEMLCNEDHPHRDFNLKQLHSICLVKKLLLISQECIQENKPSLPIPICESMLNITRNMLGSPLDVNLVKTLFDFLLISHPAVSTYVNHTRDEFFFFPRFCNEIHIPAIGNQVFLPTSKTTNKWYKVKDSDTETEIIVPENLERMQEISSPSSSPSKSDGLLILGHSNTPTSKQIESPKADSDSDINTVIRIFEDFEEGSKKLQDIKSISGTKLTDENKTSFVKFNTSALDISTNINVAQTEEDPSDKPDDGSWQLYTTENLKSVSIKLDGSFEIDDNINEDGLTFMSVGLLDILHGVIINLPDTTLNKILDQIIKLDTLVVMVHHTSSRIRAGIIKLLYAYLHRAPKIQTEQFYSNGFHLFASQLCRHNTTRPLVEACLSIIFNQQHDLDEDCDPSALMQMPEKHYQSVVLVMCLLEKSSHNIKLYHNIMCILMQLYESTQALSLKMVENGLIETLCNSLMRFIHQHNSRICDKDCQIIIEDFEHFFAMISLQAFHISGVVYYQMLEDVMNSVTLLCINYGRDTVGFNVIKSILCKVFQTMFVDICKQADNPSGSNQRIKGQRYTLSAVAFRKPAKDVNIRTHSVFRHSPLSFNFTDSFEDSEASGDQSDIFYLHKRKRNLSLDPGRRRSSLMVQGNLIFDNKKSQTKISVSELLERFKKFLISAVDFLIISEGSGSVLQEHEGNIEYCSHQVEVNFSEFLLQLLFSCILESLEKKPKSTWKSFVWNAKDSLRIQFSRLLVFMMKPDSKQTQRLYAIHLLTSEPRMKDVLKLIFASNNELGPKIVVYLYDLKQHPEAIFSFDDNKAMNMLLNVLRQRGFQPIPDDISRDMRHSIYEDIQMWQQEVNKEKEAWFKKQKIVQQKIVHKHDDLASQISTSAMDITQDVVKRQHLERKKFIEHVKMTMATGLQVKKSWQHLIQQLTHERSIWYEPEPYPKSWQIDPTEGPFRIRRRLQRCHLGIKPKYLRKDQQWKLQAETCPTPLSFIFEDDTLSSDSAALIYRLHTNEKIKHTCHCTSVTPFQETCGEILVGESCIYFVADETVNDANYTDSLSKNKDLFSMTLPNEIIREIHRRRYQLRDTALEIFLTNGKTHLLAFDNFKDREQFYRHLDSKNLPNLIKMENLTAILQLWVDGHMTNFEYLTHLNKLAGRSFNDLMQYPVFPYIIADYKSQILNLKDKESFRKLKKPVAIQHEESEERYKKTYKQLEIEYKKAMEDPDDAIGFRQLPFHYGSHYSNSGTVLHFLVRLPPFTQMMLLYQDRNFDVPDRTFHSIASSWQLTSGLSSSDVKELIPEFYFLPEFLNNNEGLDLGVRQDGEAVSNVHLPKWARNDPRLFTLILRQALESSYVTKRLHNWIDLIYGYKQTGQAAIDSVNVFHSDTYYGVDYDKIIDPVQRKATEMRIRLYGQMPKQLFSAPHPSSTGHKSGEDINYTLSVLETVEGLLWGNYVGSPDHPPPLPTWMQSYTSPITSICPLPTCEVFGLGPCCCLIVSYSKEKGVTTMNTVDCEWAGVISWGHPDGILRLRNKRQQPPLNFLHHQNGGELVTFCTAILESGHLFVGSNTGVINVYKIVFNTSMQCDIQVRGNELRLYGHTGPISMLHICKPYSVVVSASHDGTAIIWDLNTLSYVRSIEDHERPIYIVTVSDTLGDIATVSHNGDTSCLMLHSINAKYIGKTFTETPICCIAFSPAPEGRCVNVLAGGLNNGIVRLWSSWDLLPVRDINVDATPFSVLSLAYTHDAQRMFVSLSDGRVIQFETKSQTKTITNFIPLI